MGLRNRTSQGIEGHRNLLTLTSPSLSLQAGFACFPDHTVKHGPGLTFFLVKGVLVIYCNVTNYLNT